MATLGQNAFGNPGNPGQFTAIQNGANSNSLVSQLFGNKPVNFATPMTTSTPPIASSPNVQAATSQVKNPALPSNATQASLLMGPLATAPTAQTTAQVGSGSTPYVAPQSTTPVVNTPSATNPTSNPNANYSAGITQTNTGAGTPVTTPVPAASTAASVTGQPLTQQGLLGQQQALIAQQDSQQANLTSQEQALATQLGQQNQNVLTSGDEIGLGTGLMGQLQNNYTSAEGALENQQARLAQYEQPQLAALGTSASQLSPQNQAITPPAGGVTTIANTGQQYSNPIYEPASSAVQAYSPQPNGTAGQPSTAGQASQYAVKQGDSLTSIAAANGMTAAQLEAANPQITNPNLITPGENITIPPSNTGNTAFTGGEVAGQAAAGTNVVNLKGALASAISIHGQITQLLAANPQLNSSPVGLANQLNQYLNTGVIPNGPYTQLIQDLTDYAATASAALGYGGAPTDSKAILSQSLVPTLAAGGTLDAALTNLETTIQGKVNAQTAVGQNPNAPITPANTTNTSSSAAGSWAWTPTQ